MGRTGKYAPKNNPEESDRSPHGTGKGTKDGAKSGNVQKLNEKNPPPRKWHIVNAIWVRTRRCRPIFFDSEYFFDQFPPDKVPADEQCQCS